MWQLIRGRQEGKLIPCEKSQARRRTRFARQELANIYIWKQSWIEKKVHKIEIKICHPKTWKMDRNLASSSADKRQKCQLKQWIIGQCAQPENANRSRRIDAKNRATLNQILAKIGRRNHGKRGKDWLKIAIDAQAEKSKKASKDRSINALDAQE